MNWSLTGPAARARVCFRMERNSIKLKTTNQICHPSTDVWKLAFKLLLLGEKYPTTGMGSWASTTLPTWVVPGLISGVGEVYPVARGGDLCGKSGGGKINIKIWCGHKKCIYLHSSLLDENWIDYYNILLYILRAEKMYSIE